MQNPTGRCLDPLVLPQEKEMNLLRFLIRIQDRYEYRQIKRQVMSPVSSVCLSHAGLEYHPPHCLIIQPVSAWPLEDRLFFVSLPGKWLLADVLRSRRLLVQNPPSFPLLSSFFSSPLRPFFDNTHEDWNSNSCLEEEEGKKKREEEGREEETPVVNLCIPSQTCRQRSGEQAFLSLLFLSSLLSIKELISCPATERQEERREGEPEENKSPYLTAS